jgi:hypothetical protein
VLVLYGVGLLGGTLALLVRRFPLERPFMPVALAGVTILLAVMLFERLPYERQKLPNPASQPL